MLLYWPWKHQESRVLSCKLKDNDITSLHSIRRWVLSQNPSKISFTHWWQKELPPELYEQFMKVAHSDVINETFMKHFGSNYVVYVICDMNEVYVSAPSCFKETSDDIFYTRHIEGPYFYLPFASCYRMIVGMDDNKEITTVFNMVPEEHTIQKGDCVAFDFHRECHYIRQNKCEHNKDYRVVLKIHYCVYPNSIITQFFGRLLTWLSIHYNKNFRNLFLCTPSPNNKEYTTHSMILVTKIIHDIEYYIGYNNISFTFLLWVLSRFTHYHVFLYGTSFIHYIRLIDSVYHNCNNKILQRDYHFYKTLYMFQILYLYIINTYHNANYLGALMILFSYYVYFMDVALLSRYCDYYIVMGLLNSIEFSVGMKYYLNAHIFFNFFELLADLSI
jgi:hypothetical protein